MFGRGALAVLLFSPALLLGQLSNNSVTVTASQSANSTADQAVFTISVQASVSTTLDTVVGSLAGVGITAANLTGFTTQTAVVATNHGQPGTVLVWNFQLTAPLAKMSQTIAALTALEQTLPQNQSGLSLSFSLSGTQASAPAACNAATLIPVARTQAQAIASGAGLTAGAIRAMTTQTGGSVCSLTATFALGLLFGQDQHTITITASRSTNLQPDQALIALTVNSPLTSGQDDINAALSKAGITGATFTGVTSTQAVGVGVNASQSVLQWSYTLTAPIANASSTVALLLATQQSGLGLTFFVEGLQVSQALQNAQSCPESGLVSDANAAAQTLASAAGVSVGPILSIAGPGTAGTPGVVFASLYVGVFSELLTPAPNNCSLTIQYQMLP